MIRSVLAKVLAHEAPELGEVVSVSLSFVDNEQIQTINRDHRGIDKPTDVLSFAQLEGEELGTLPPGEPLPLGDIVISLQRCVEQAADYGHSFDRELGFLMVHGMLHLLGHDHQTPEAEAEMMAKTEAILSELGLTRT
jgi:probable rRNA maturation factor